MPKRLFLVGLVFGLLALGAPAYAQTYPDAVGAEKARQSVREAKSELRRAEARYREAGHVLSATLTYREKYGIDVARWVGTARRAGWKWSDIDQLMYIVWRESRGQPSAKNPESTASGLVQFLAFHWDGSGDYGWRFDPFDPYQNLYYAHKLFLKLGWQPWAVM